MPSHYKRKRRYKRGKSAYSIAKKALHKVNKISRGVELKFYDRDLTQVDITSSGTFSAVVNDISQGLGDSQRIGDKFLMTHMELRGRCPIGPDLNNTQLRMIVFYDKRETIQIPLDLLAFVDSGLAPLSMYNHDKRGDWIKLWDKTFMLTGVNTSVAQFRKIIKLNKTSVFDGGTTDFTKGRINVLYISNIAAGQPASNYPDAFVESRVYYQDS